MDVAEPNLTARVRGVLARAQETFTPWQANQVAAAAGNMPFERGMLSWIEDDITNAARLRAHAHRNASKSNRTLTGQDPFDQLPPLLAHAVERPLVTSALVWRACAAYDLDFTQYVLQAIRMRAGLPTIRRRFGEEGVPSTMPAMLEYLGDRLLVDLGAWMQTIPSPFGPDERATLARQREAIEAARAAAPRVANEELAGFLQRAASFFVHLSMRRNDPIGFPLSRQAALTTDPSLDQRIELAAWARRAGHRISLHGRVFVLSIDVEAPWPLRLQLIAAELGQGHCGGPALLLRLDAGGTIAVVSHATAMVCLADDTVEERGKRFERWLAIAYPQAVQAWRVWC